MMIDRPTGRTCGGECVVARDVWAASFYFDFNEG